MPLLLGCTLELDELREFGNTDTEAARALCVREGFVLCWPRAFTVWITVCASGPSYGLMVADSPVVDDVRMAGGKATVFRYARLATAASWKTINRLVSSLHFILKPPDMDSYSEKAAWISFVFNSFGKPVR